MNNNVIKKLVSREYETYQEDCYEYYLYLMDGAILNN